jgi:colicin import membrane protein
MSEITVTFGEGVETNYAAILLDDEQISAFTGYLRAKGLPKDANAATPEGRKAINSRAYAVARHKTALDAAGKAMTDDWRKKTNEVNARRNKASDVMEALQAEIKKPVAEWETQEASRLKWCQDIMAQFDRDGRVSIDDTADAVTARLGVIKAIEINFGEFAEMFDTAVSAKHVAVETLTAAVARLTKQEADSAELERLRLDAAQRAEEDAARVAAEEAEKLAAEARAARERIEAERAEAARKQAEAAAAIAAEQAKAEAERQAIRALEEEKARAANALAEQQRLHQEEIARVQREADAKAAAEARVKEEDARRAADADHREEIVARVMDEAAHDVARIMLVSESTAGVLVRAIADGRVRNVKMVW